MSHGAQERITPYMKDILRIVVKGNADGTFCDLDQILDRLEVQRTKQSIQFTIRTMIKKGLIAKKGKETRRNKSRVVIVATTLGYEQATQRFTVEESKELLSLFD